jgi:transcriptional regulator with XRE-family HTH domain
MKKVENKYRRIPNSLRKYRKISGYTQKQVAERMGVKNAGMISKWENGTRFPDYLNILRLAALYSCLSEALFFDLNKVVKDEMSRGNNISGKGHHRQL